MSNTPLSLDQFLNSVGRKPEPSDWIVLDQSRIDAFADCTEDHQFIHVDPEAAKSTPFGTTIAHGFLSLSMLAKMAEGLIVAPEGMVMGMNYGFDKVRFLAPVKSGKRIRGRSEIISIEQKDEKRFLLKQAITVEIEGEDKPALIAEWLNMLFIA
ncbi:MAG: acyl dehydratase [Pseudoalteromonas tetraodonis]|jgi:acyl dehydratase